MGGAPVIAVKGALTAGRRNGGWKGGYAASACLLVLHRPLHSSTSFPPWRLLPWVALLFALLSFFSRAFFLLFSWLIITACGIIYRHSCHFHYSKAALAFCFTLSHAAGEVTMGPSRCRALALALTIVYQQIEWSEWWTRRQQSNSKRWAGAAGSDPCALANRQ